MDKVLELFKNPRDAILLAVAFGGGYAAHSLQEAHSTLVTQETFEEYKSEVQCGDIRYYLEQLEQRIIELAIKEKLSSTEEYQMLKAEKLAERMRVEYAKACIQGAE